MKLLCSRGSGELRPTVTSPGHLQRFKTLEDELHYTQTDFNVRLVGASPAAIALCTRIRSRGSHEPGMSRTRVAEPVGVLAAPGGGEP